MTTGFSIYFEMHHLDRFAIIDEPCTMRIRNHTDLRWDNMYTEDGHNRWIVNLKAITSDNLEEVIDVTIDTFEAYTYGGEEVDTCDISEEEILEAINY